MMIKRVHLTEEASSRTSITGATASMVTVRVVRGYGLELTLFESMSSASPAKVTYRDLNPTRAGVVKTPMTALAYTLRRRPGVNEPFDIEVSYHEAAPAEAGT